MTSPLVIHGLTVSYTGEAPAVDNIDVQFEAGLMHAIVGPNGAGKSTLIKGVLGLVTPQAGQVRFWDHPFFEMRHRVAYVPQRSVVDWHFPVTVWDVVAMGLYPNLRFWQRFSKAQKQAIRQAIVMVGLTGLERRQIGNLSGGQQQRVFIARALVQDPDLFILDEPFAGVDAATEKTIISLLRDLRDAGKTVIAVHHDLATVPEYFDSVTLFNRHVIASGLTHDVFCAETIAQAFGGWSPMQPSLAQAS
jgi:manganese/zinc/iron transport system ATP- binding protein